MEDHVIREYSALALMSFFVITMIWLLAWATKRIVGRALDNFDRIREALETVEQSIGSIKEAIDENTVNLVEHRRETQLFVERLSREGKENGKR